MKKFKFFTLFIIMSATVYGQDIILSFAGEGASTDVTTVEVVNLSNCTSIEVPGGSSLNLTTGTVGVKEFKNLSVKFCQTYPNPFVNSTNLKFYLSQSDCITVTICDITGKIAAEYSKELKTGIHSFEFTPKKYGMYFINISGRNFIESSKVICLSNNSQQANLSYNDQVLETIPDKSFKPMNSKDFTFEVGDTLKLKGISGDYNYATVIIEKPTTSGTYTFNFVPCQDADGNNYSIVEIGSQTWMAENVKTTSYVGGGDIPLVTDNTTWANLEDNNTDKAYCYYNNDPTNGDIYGAFYTYAAATNGDNSGTGVQGVCPIGWHVPSDEEWTALTNELGGEWVAGGKLKSYCMGLWMNPNTGASNETGFSALPGGGRLYDDGTFYGIGNYCYWLSASEGIGSHACVRYLHYSSTGVYRDYFSKSNGLSVRCLRD